MKGNRQIGVLKEAFAFLQVLLLPVGEGVELNPTHLQKVLKIFKDRDVGGVVLILLD